MRKLLIALVIVVALVVIAALALPSFLDVNRYHDRIQAELQGKLGRPVTLGRMNLSIIPLAFRVENVAVGEDPHFNTGKPFATARELYVTAKLMPLLHSDVQVDSLELRKPQIELVRDAQGTWNFSTMGKTGAPAQQPPSPPARTQPSQTPAPSQPSQQQAFSLDKLSIVDGQVGLTDMQKHQPRAVYDHIDLTLKGYEPGKPFDLDLAAHLPGPGAEKVSLTGTAGPVPQGSMTDMPFDGTLKLEQVSLSGAQKFLNTQALAGIEGSASGHTKVRNDKGTVTTSGSLQLTDARIHGNDVGYPISLDYDLTDDLNSEMLHISKGDLKLGSTPMSISGTLNLQPTPSQLDVKLTASNVSIDEAARLAAAFGVAFDPGMKISGRLNADVRAQGPATKPLMNGTISASNLNIVGKDLPSPVQVQGIDLALSPDTIRSNDFTASTGSTSLGAQFTLAGYASTAPNVDATLHTSGAKIGELLNIAKAYGVSAADGMSGSGTISLDLHAQGPLKNSAAMNFSGNGQIQNASLTMPQITKPVSVRNANLRFTQNSMMMDNLNASLGSTNATGSMSVKDFSAPQLQFSIAADRMIVAEWQQMFPNVQATPQKAAFLSLVPSAYAASPEPSLLSKTTGTGTLAVATVQYDQLVLNNVRGSVNLDHGVIRMSPVNAEVYGGSQSGTIVVDTRPTPAVYTVTTNMKGVDANKLLSSVSSLKQTLYGLMSANANGLTFTGSNADQMAHSLNGTLALDLVKGKLVGIDVLHQLAQAAQFVGGGTQQMQANRGFTDLVQLTGNFDVRNGLAQTNNLHALIDGGSLAAIGAVNLADQTLNMHLTAVLSKAVSDSVGGTSVGGFMQTALANNKGELVIPIIVTGSFQHPSFAPDVQQIAQMKLKNMVPTLSNPAAMTSIVGAILGQKGPTGQPGQGQQQGGLGGILGTITGQQQQQRQQAEPNQQQPQQQQQQQQPASTGNVLQDILGAVARGQNKQQPQQQQQNQQQQQQPPQNGPPKQPQ